MANRSYLYNVGFNQLDRVKTENDSILSVSEYAYQIPLTYKILLSADTRRTKSVIWDYEHPISIIGDAKKGRSRLLEFLDKLQSMNLYDEDYLKPEIEKTKQFFTTNKFDLQYFFLEGGELYEMGDQPFENQNLQIFNEITQLDQTIELFKMEVDLVNKHIAHLISEKNKMTKKTWFKKSKPVLSTDEKNKIQRKIDYRTVEKRAYLGIDNWSTVLYYQFNN